jgi:hypothetical protein
MTARKIAEFLESIEVEEAILIQRLSDLESRSVQGQPVPSAKLGSEAADYRRESPVVSDRQPRVDPPAPIKIYGEI